MNADDADLHLRHPRSSAVKIDQLIGIEIEADPAFPGGKRFCRAILNALASPPEACVTRPDSS